MIARTPILPPPPEEAPASRPCMPPPAWEEEPADSARLTDVDGLDVDSVRAADDGAWYERGEEL